MNFFADRESAITLFPTMRHNFLKERPYILLALKHT